MARHRAPRRAFGLARGLALLSVASLAATGFLLATVGLHRATAATADSSFTATETISRDHLINGTDSIADTRTVSVHVDVTKGLRNRQGVHINWTGAHPTGGVIYDNTSQYAINQEYPVAILQCRGVDSASAPAGQRLSPRSCYTQTPNQRYESPFRGVFPAYRLDRYATPADRQLTVGAPNPRPAACVSGDGAERWMPYDAAGGKSYYGGYLGCAGLAPDQSVVTDPLSPPSTTFATTGADGSGSADFIVQNAESNASLGCSATVPCAIVIIPIMGISCDASATALPAADRPADPAEAQLDCGGTGFYAPGEPSTNQKNDDPNVQMTVSGQLWWSASNWRNRITVPITMAQTAAVCDITSGGTPENLYGSEYAGQLIQQWAPRFCLDSSLFRLQQVETSEVQAKNLLANGVTGGHYLDVKAAVQAGPPATPFANPIVQAPTAISGFAIAFIVDDAKHNQLTRLKLNARLLAKLMTMSYPALPSIEADWAGLAKYSALSHNPLDIVQDPEFLALNPGAALPVGTINQIWASSTLFMMSSDSDVMTALTSYLNADPDARAWLDGKPDPWGMVVNPNYRKIALPVTSWPQLDTYYNPLDGRCVADGKFPILPLVAGPVSDPSLITFNLQYGISNSQVSCTVYGQTDDPNSRRLTAEGRQQPGIRFLLGLVSLADAARYQLTTAELQSQADGSAPVRFSDDSGRTFVAPTDDSLLRAAKLLRPDSNLNTWTLPYDTLRTDPAGALAYPGTLLISTDVPTIGLAAADAANLAKFLSYAAGPGQQPGTANGQLPAGYLPITPGNGLANLVDFTTKAAAEVAAQHGRVPLVGGGYSGPSSPPSSAGGSASGGSASGSTGTGARSGSGGSAGAGGSTGSVAAGAGSTSNSKASGGPTSAPIALRPAGYTRALSPGWLGMAVPVLAVLGLVSAAGSLWLSGIGRR